MKGVLRRAIKKIEIMFAEAVYNHVVGRQLALIPPRRRRRMKIK
jgi:hypothetical protein